MEVCNADGGQGEGTHYCAHSGAIWTHDISVCLANHLISNPDVLSHQKVVLELGSGTGLVGIVAHQLSVGATVYLTDVDLLVLERLNRNVELNKPSTGNSLLVRTLDWDAPTEWRNEKPNLILAADVRPNEIDRVACRDCPATKDMGAIPLMLQSVISNALSTLSDKD
ncbi:uncharacterized protein MELLADRAFT_105471 [Melampsora larici-populina 98AG31]|uniref:Methyltransferase small domain-containing protein n=1 Tax=Melampsora larici-populina (strain 98AG31 / pathotype 3-4-7) TaxID=747676 RepID=F4RI84_MELLP|nr:uncharacterized protein MELLADRAFT_105471 [Melampsora larici-populina 98AG31]EGG08009.1 hypothetical protein MELLADRAFT_105471 [Melampsora larici-populina 98AG31]